MLTCEQINEQARQIGVPVVRGNYEEIAERIHVRTDGPTGWLYLSQDELLAIPEYVEYRRACLFSTPDYTDMLVVLVTLWQFHAAYHSRFDIGSA